MTSDGGEINPAEKGSVEFDRDDDTLISQPLNRIFAAGRGEVRVWLCLRKLHVCQADFATFLVLKVPHLSAGALRARSIQFKTHVHVLKLQQRNRVCVFGSACRGPNR